MKLLVESQLILDASESLNALAKAVSRDGSADIAESLFQQAAGLELASPDLQNCWGGPFNGQRGRQAMVLDLLRTLGPVAIIETGAFRGITTEWLAAHFSGPVFACEKERLYYLQAEARLNRFPNVSLALRDSRLFLRDILDSLPKTEISFFYLDAHWQLDLPLREELQLIFEWNRKAVVLIDDFKVPNDSGYGWDDYGPNRSLEIKLLDGVIPKNFKVFFPSLHSSEETGGVRGCCVIASETSTRVEECALLLGDSLEHLAQLANSSGSSMSEISSPIPTERALSLKSEQERPELTGSVEETFQILKLRARLAETEGNRRLGNILKLTDEIEQLQSQLAKSHEDRAIRLSKILALTADVDQLRLKLAESEGDRAQRLNQILDLTVDVDQLRLKLGESEEDRARRLNQILDLTADVDQLRLKLAESEEDRARRLNQILDLTADVDQLRLKLAESEEDRAQRLRDVLTLTAELERLRK
jgi:predicted O-methyltransferase YrrM